MSYAVIKTGGKQFLVEEGQTIRVPSIAGGAGKSIELERIAEHRRAVDGTRFRRLWSTTAKIRRSSSSRKSVANSTNANMVTVRVTRQIKIDSIGDE